MADLSYSADSFSAVEPGEMAEMDELFHYIPEIPEENFLEISQFVLLPAADEEGLQNVTENNNNVQSEERYKENLTQPSNSRENMILVTMRKDAEGTVSESFTGMTRAKRGRPPSKPPTREVVKKRRKVS